jgi:hypothetical protein
MCLGFTILKAFRREVWAYGWSLATWPWLAFRAVSALKGTWLDDHTFMMDWLTLGEGPAHVWTFTFDGDKLNLQGTRLDGSKISAIGNTGG